MAKSSTRRVNIYINGKEVETSIKEVRKEMNRLINEQNRMTIGSDEYVAHAKKIRELREIIKEHSRQIGTLKSGWEELYDKVMQFGTGVGGFVQIFQAIDGVTDTLKQVATDLASMDDIYSDVMKTTGLTHEQVELLNETFKKMDTRTSREQLNNLAYIAGKLGLSTEELVQQFVEAADVINVSMGDVLGDDATLAIGKMADVYKQTSDTLAEKDLKGQLLSLGSAVNELGQSSTANEAYMVNFAGRLGGIAVQARLSADEILGYASALDQDMQKVEMSATAFQKLIQKIISKPAEFARIAGMEVEKFTELIETDMNTAIKSVLKGFQGSGGFDKLVPLFKDLGLDGARAAAAISSMANSLDKVEEAQAIANKAMEEGVSCTNEFNVKNNNLQASLEKARKKFQDTRLELGEKLYPILLKLTKTSTAGLKLLSQAISWMDKNRLATIALIAPVTLYVSKLALAKTWMLGIQSLEKTGIAIKSAYKAAVYALALAKAKLAGNTARAAAAMRAMQAASAATPWTAIATAIAAAAVAIYKFATRTTAAEDAMKEFRQESARQRGECDELFNRLKKLEKGTKEYNEVQQKIIDTYPEILKDQVDEEGNLYNIRDAYNAVTEAIESNIAKRIKSEKSASVYSTKIEKIGAYLGNGAFPESEWGYIKEQADKGASAEDIIAGLNNKYGEQYKSVELSTSYAGYSPVSTAVKTPQYSTLLNIVKTAKEANAELEKIDKQLTPFIKDVPEIKEEHTQSGSGSGGGGGDDDGSDSYAAKVKKKKDEWEQLKKKVHELSNENDRLGKEKVEADKMKVRQEYEELVAKIETFIQSKGQAAKDLAAQVRTYMANAIEDIDREARKEKMKKVTESYDKLCEQFGAIEDKLNNSPTNKYAAELNDIRAKWEKMTKEMDENIRFYEEKSKEEYDPAKGTGLSEEETALLNKLLEKRKEAVELETRQELDVVRRAEQEITQALLTEKEKRIASLKKEYAERIAIANTAIEELKKKDEAGNKDRIQALLDQIEALKKQLDKELADIEGEDKKKKKGLAGLFDIDWKDFKKNWEENLNEILDVVQDFTNQATALFNSISDLQKDNETRLLNQYKQNYDERKEKLDWQLEQGIISQEYYDAQVQQLDEELAKKEKEIELEQFRRQKRAAIAEAVISGIVSAVKSFENGGGFPWGLIPMALSLATTGVQVAAIASEPEPYAKGGYIEQQKHILAGENGREWIASHRLLQDPQTAPVIEALEQYQQGNRSAWKALDFAQPDGAALSQAAGTISRNFAADNTLPSATDSHTTATDSETLSKMLEQLTALTSYMSDPKNRQAVISREMQLEFEQQENFLRKAAALK